MIFLISKTISIENFYDLKYPQSFEYICSEKIWFSCRTHISFLTIFCAQNANLKLEKFLESNYSRR